MAKKPNQEAWVCRGCGDDMPCYLISKWSPEEADVPTLTPTACPWGLNPNWQRSKVKKEVIKANE